MISRFGYRVVKARWAVALIVRPFFRQRLNYLAMMEIGILSKISDIIAKDLRVNLRSINIDTNDGHFRGLNKTVCERCW